MVTFKLTTVSNFTGDSSKAPFGILNIESSNKMLCFGSKTGGFIAVLSLLGRELLNKAEVNTFFDEIKKTDLPETLHPIEGFGKYDRPFYKEADVDYRQIFSGLIN